MGALLACHPREAERPPAEAAAVAVTRDTVLLTGAAPRAVIPLPPGRIPVDATALEVPIARIENEARVPFSFRARLAWGSAAGDTVDLGTFSVYPPDRAGRYLVGVRGEMRPNVRDAARALVLELEPITPGALQGRVLRVHVAPPAWRRGP